MWKVSRFSTISIDDVDESYPFQMVRKRVNTIEKHFTREEKPDNVHAWWLQRLISTHSLTLGDFVVKTQSARKTFFTTIHTYARLRRSRTISEFFKRRQTHLSVSVFPSCMRFFTMNADRARATKHALVKCSMLSYQLMRQILTMKPNQIMKTRMC